MVEVLDAGGNIISSQNVGSLLTYQEVPNPNFSLFKYRIKAISNGTETMVSYSNVMEVDLSPQLHMPNTFTPNGDGVNDSFIPKGKYFTNFKLTVFNKWGEVIFVTDDALAGWDGTYKNEPVSLDTYSYYVQAESNGGDKIAKRGVVTVLR
jgi:gliding motility-associated-like protein